MPRFVMKLTLKFILTISLMAISVTGFATESSVQQICNVFTSGQVQPLSEILDSNIEVSILGESVVCNKDYAMNAVNDFINNNPKCSCKISHYGKRENSSFCIILIVLRHHLCRHEHRAHHHCNNHHLFHSRKF